MPKRYDPAIDEFVEVTQEWIDWIEKEFAYFGKCRTAAKEIVAEGGPKADLYKHFLESWTPYWERSP